MTRSIRGAIASCAVAAGLLLFGPAAQAQTKVIHVHGTHVRVDSNDDLPARETHIDLQTAPAATQQVRTETRMQGAVVAPASTARFVIHNGTTYQIDENGRLMGAYSGTAQAASLNARLSRGSAGLLPGDPSHVSVPGSGYNQTAAIRASQAALLRPTALQNPSAGVTTGTSRTTRLDNTPDQNVLSNGVATGPMGQYFYPANTTGFLESPLFPIPPNLTVATPYPGQVSLPTSGSAFAPGSLGTGFMGPPGSYYYNAATYFNAGNIPITNTLVPNGALPNGITSNGTTATSPTGVGGTVPVITSQGVPTATGTGLGGGNQATGITLPAPGGPFSR